MLSSDQYPTRTEVINEMIRITFTSGVGSLIISCIKGSLTLGIVFQAQGGASECIK